MTPLIGVSTSDRGGWRSFLAIRFAIWRAGGKAVRISPSRGADLGPLHGLIAGGGDDIGAEIYGGELMPDVREDPERDALEAKLLPTAIERRLPVLGICRGSQMINIVLGGSLHQEIHEIYVEAPRLRTILPKKTVHVGAGTRLDELLACQVCKVNALHHQSVDRLGEGLMVSAQDEHGMVQGTEATDDRPVLGVQWHPELMPFRRGQMNLFRWIVARARTYAGAPEPAA